MTSTTTPYTDAWHVLGQPIPEARTAEEALSLGGLAGWNVRKRPLTVALESERVMDVPGRYAVVRDLPDGGSAILGPSVGGRYEPMQNEALCPLLDSLADETGARYSVAGSLDGGARVFVSMVLPEPVLVGGTDRVDMVVSVMTSHDGSMPTRVMATPVHAATGAVLNVDYRGRAGSYGLRHTPGARGAQEDQLPDLLRAVREYQIAFQEWANPQAPGLDLDESAVSRSLSPAEFARSASRSLGIRPGMAENARARLANRLERQIGLFSDMPEGIRGTAWAGFLAMAAFFDHHCEVRAATEGEARVARARRALFIPGGKEKAYKIFS